MDPIAERLERAREAKSSGRGLDRMYENAMEQLISTVLAKGFEPPTQRAVVARAAQAANTRPPTGEHQLELVDAPPTPTTSAARERARPKPKQPWVCPVGMCIPTSAAPAPTREGEFCPRHWGKLSSPMADALAAARRQGGDRFAKVFAEALQEARQNDEHWARWAIWVDGRIETHGDWRLAVARHAELLADDRGAKLISGITGNEVSEDEIRAYTPHEVQDENGRVMGRGETLRAAIRAALESAKRLPTIPKLTVVDLWTGEVTAIDRACAIAERGERK